MAAQTTEPPLLHHEVAGAGPPLLLVHGLMVSGRMYDPIRPHLAARHRLVLPDLRGHGRSRTLPPPYTAVALAEDLVRLLDHLRIDRTAVLGYSNGGIVAQQFARDHADRCDRLVLGATFAYNMATRREWIEGHLAPWIIRTLGMRRFARLGVSGSDLQLGPEQRDWLAGLMGEQDTRLMLTAWKQTMAFDSRDWLGQIRCPTLVIAGSADVGIPIHHAHQLHQGIPDARLVVIEGGDHTMIWSRTAEFLAAVDDFLDA